MRIGEIIINDDAHMNIYDRCSTNSYVIFRNHQDLKMEGIEFACYDDQYEMDELEEMYPFNEYTIRAASIDEEISSGRQIIDISLE